MADKVLVIDDHLPSAQVLQWSMESMGHEACIAMNAKEAFQILEDFTPDIVLCDIKLPDQSGYEICTKIRADKRFKDTLLLAQTGYDSRDKKQQSYDAGFHYHFVKPVNLEKLFEIVDLDRNKNRMRDKRASTVSAT